ncbi:NADH/ubiquinone/plastoquinone (complex I) [bacterium]|nr:NADH/ubiquinone/plastoquinone (complex I) [bacterium]
MNILPLFIVIPLGFAFLLPFLAKLWRNIPDIIGNLATLILTIMTFWMLGSFNHTIVFYAGGWQPVNHIPIGISMVADGLSLFMLLIINFVGLMVTIYSVDYMRHYTDKVKYYILFLLMIAGLNGVVLAGDFFNMFVFLEISAIASYSLVAFGVGAEELEASFKYQVLGGTASAFILFAIAILYRVTGTLNMADASKMISNTGMNSALMFTAILFFVGFSLKAALIPFHAWLPDAHPSAPAPISAMLSGVVIKVLGVYALIRIFFNVFGISQFKFLSLMLLVFGTLSMVVGGILAVGQKDVKRMLAYSSISQIGCVIFALGLGTSLGYFAALFHMMNHAAFKSLLFLDSGAIVYRTGTRDMEKMGGLGDVMPLTSGTSLIGSLSISGIPPFAGFWSKLLIVIAAVQSKHFILALVFVLVSIITIVYFMKFNKMVFQGKLNKIFQDIKEVPVMMSIPMVILAILSITMGLLLIPGLKTMILSPAANIIAGGLNYVQMVLGG